MGRIRILSFLHFFEARREGRPRSVNHGALPASLGQASTVLFFTMDHNLVAHLMPAHSAAPFTVEATSPLIAETQHLTQVAYLEMHNEIYDLKRQREDGLTGIRHPHPKGESCNSGLLLGVWTRTHRVTDFRATPQEFLDLSHARKPPLPISLVQGGREGGQWPMDRKLYFEYKGIQK